MISYVLSLTLVEEWLIVFCETNRLMFVPIQMLSNRTPASQPRPSARFGRVSEPPCSSAIWRQGTRQTPVRPGFCDEVREKEFLWMNISDHTPTQSTLRDPG